ncbi:hypothetical protein D3C84_840600 [compost metagenome]
MEGLLAYLANHYPYRQALRDPKQVIQGRLAVSQLPVLVTFIHLIGKLNRRHCQHDFAQNRNKQPDQVQQVQPGTLIPL